MLFARLLFAALLLACHPALSAELPSSSQVEERISQLEGAEPADPNLLEQYQALARQLASIARLREDLERLRESAAQFPQRKLNLQQQLEQLNQDTEVVLPELPTVNAVEQELATVRARNDAWNQQLQDIKQRNSDLLSESEQLPSAIAQQEQALQQSRVAVEQQSPGSEPLSEVRAWLLEAQRQFDQLTLDLLLLNQKTLVARRELGVLESQVITRQRAMAANQLELLQVRLQKAQRESTRQRQQEAEALGRELSDAPEVIRQWNELNKRLTTESEQLTTELLATQGEFQELEIEQQRRLLRMNQIRADIDWLKRSPEFSSSLRIMLKELPEPPQRTGLAGRISTAHLKGFELNQQLDKVSNTRALVNKLAEQHQLNDNDRQLLQQVLSFRLTELNKLLQSNSQLITELSRLEALRQQYATQLALDRDFLREQQFWLRGRLALWDEWYPSIDLWLGTDDLSATLAQVGNQLWQLRNSLILLMIALAFLLLLQWRLLSFLKRQMAQYAKVIGQVRRDSFAHTLALIATTLVVASLVPLWLLLFDYWARVQLPSRYTLDMGQFIRFLAVFYLVWEALCLFSRDTGLFIEHFNWPRKQTLRFHRYLSRQRWFVYPYTLAMVLAEALSGEQEATLLRVMMMGLMLWLLLFWWRLLRNDNLPNLVPFLRGRNLLLQGLRLLVILPLLAMIGLQLWGFSYASWITLLYHQLTLLDLFSTLLIFQLGQRWFALEQRQLALQRALAKREEQLERRQQGEEHSDLELDESQLPVEAVSEQSMALLHLGVLVYLLSSLSAIWADGLVIYQWMENITVWQVSITTEAGIELQAITLREALLAVVIVVVTLLAAQNLPGFLELLILRRMEISTGAAYATTTLVRYVLVMAGVIAGITILGFHWSKLQWLVAALSVGLGFGLQEIFANLVSGIILLFERPVRVGDTITINDLSGTVTRINTRATTIVDWDRKEIVVPNKALITDKLINWSLTDGVTRLIIPIGVAYGSDVPLVKRLLWQVIREQHDVLAEPEPQVLFLSFGASSLNFEVRVFLPRLDLRLQTLDALHTQIDSVFKEHEVEIAFPQMDIHVRDMPREDKD